MRRIYFMCKLAIFVLLFPVADGRSSAWISEKRDVIQSAKTSKNAQSVEKLGILIHILGEDQRKGELTPETEELFAESRRAIVDIPGYTEILVQKINAGTERELKTNSAGMDRYYYCEVLAQIHTPESFKALGDLLFDERDPWKDLPTAPDPDASGPRPTAYYAVQAFHQMRLQKPPVPEQEFDENVSAWQHWYREILDGKGTFSYIGDNRVYTINGPIKNDSVAPQLPRTTTPVTDPSAREPGWTLWIALIAVAGAALAAVVWIRKGSRKSGA